MYMLSSIGKYNQSVKATTSYQVSITLLVLESPVWSGFSVSRDPNRDPNRLAFLPEPKITRLDRK